MVKRSKTQAGRNKTKNIWYLPKPWILEELYSRRLIMLAISVICGTLLLLIIWASIARIDESAIALGELQPINKINILEHLEGGIVKTLYVRSGDTVKKGQLLVKLDDVAFLADLNQAKTKQSELQLDKNRLQAFIKNLDISSDKINANNLNHDDERAYLAIQYKVKADELAVADARITKQEKEIHRLQSQVTLTRKNLALLDEEKSMFIKLREQQIVSHRDFINVQKIYNETQKELNSLITQEKQSYDVLNEAKHEKAKVISSLNESAAKQIDTINTELAVLEQTIIKLNDKVERTKIRAPIAGEVSGLDVNTGEVLAQNAEIMTLVPEKAVYQVIAEVQPVDIGHIKVGDQAIVKVFAYDFARYGSIKGRVIKISAKTFLDDDKKPYYKATIALENQYVKFPKNSLRTGMTAQVDIVTGSKTILQYLFKPVHVTVASSLNER